MTQAIIIIAAGAVLFLLLFRLYWNSIQGEFIQPITEPKSYRLKAYVYFYKGMPPTSNESAFHSPQIPVSTCMVLKEKSHQGKYIVFEIKANECKGGEQKLNGCEVYYETELFNKLAKIEL